MAHSDLIQLHTLLPQQKLVLERSALLRVVAFFSGEGEFFFHSRIEDFEKNSVFVFPCGEEVRIQCSSYQEVTLGILPVGAAAASELSCDTQLQLLVEEYLPKAPALRRTVFTAAAFEQINHFFTLMYSEYSSPRPYSKRIFSIIRNALIALLAREYYCANPAGEGGSGRIARTLGVVESVKQAIQNRYDEPLSLEILAHEQHISPPYLSALFKKKTGVGLIEYLNTVRIKHAQELLLDSEELVVDIAAAAGFNSTSHFDLTFRRFTGFSPLEYRSKFKNL